ncbi:MAG TPA: hypothetical protein VHC22_15725 [Pirellulales bacterium]|nr:hypothetical protein [Pirellulales bacterium]
MTDTRSRRSFLLVRSLALFAALLGISRRAGGDEMPRPHWIWTSPEADASLGRGFFHKTFTAPAGVIKTSLLIMADDRATVFVDGENRAEAVDYQRPLKVALGELAAGEHRIAVECVNESGPAGLLLRLEMTLADGSRRWLSTDDSWSAAMKPDEARVAAADLGPLGVKPWGDPTGEVDDYHQWKQAVTGLATDPATIAVPDGFEIELVRTARPEEGSWISLDFDPRGRLVVAREDQGLLRFTLPAARGGDVEVETIDDTLRECRGLLHAYDALYVNANNSKALYRLRDTDGDDRFDECELLMRTEGGVGHGRNDLALGPDGMIYLIHGNNVRLPDGLESTSPLRNYGEDRLLGCTWDTTLFDSDVRAPAGHLLRTDRDGRRRELVAGGLRNCYGIDFNTDGELFSYESDMEWDVGLPWYRPTRVLHLVSGGDYGYRQGTKMWMAWSPDAAPSSLDIGKGSPTGVKFGTRSRFPRRYRQGLFILDWAYGRIFAVHLTPQGAGYDCQKELFLKGRPLNVTDLDFGPDGAMYFAVGGRRTQSALYRVRYVGAEHDEPRPTAEDTARDEEARRARELRRELESFHGHVDARAVDAGWPHLDSRDVWIRQAARVAIERQPVEQWTERAFREERPTAALTALMALARVGQPALQGRIVSRLGQFRFDELNEEQQLIALRAWELALLRLGPPALDVAAELARKVDEIYPSQPTSPRVNPELCELLVALDVPAVVEKTMGLVPTVKTQEERLRYLFALRGMRRGWTLDQRRAYLSWLGRPEAFSGAHTMPAVLANVRRDALGTLSDEEREKLSPLLAAKPQPVVPAPPATPRPFVWDWQLADLGDSLDGLSAGRNFARGRDMYRAATCDRCHRLAGNGAAVGPELTGCGSRFGRKDLLETILTPSKFVDEKYRDAALELADGRVIVGRITHDDGESLTVATSPLDPTQVVKVARREVESRTASLVSPMPSGLLNSLSRDEILDLLAYLIADGNEDQFHTSFDDKR